MPLWTDSDFETVFHFFTTIRAALADPQCLVECREQLIREADDASRHFGNIFDATH